MKLKNNITFPKGIAFINEVLGTVFITDEKTGHISYADELYHYALGLAIAKYFGDYILTNDMEKDYAAAITALEENNKEYSAQRTYLIKSIQQKVEDKKWEIARQNITVVSQFDILIPPIKQLLVSLKEKVEQFDPEQINTEQLKSFLSQE